MSRLPATAFVGRAAELAEAQDVLTSSAAGSTAGVLVAGDAGVGKTRFVGEVADRARAQGWLVLVGRCIDLGAGGLPYLPFAEALVTLVRAGGEPAGVVRRAVERRPSLARLAGGADGGTGDEPMERLPLLDALSGVLQDLAADVAPVLLVLEDLHWADSASRDGLRFLLSRAGAARLVVMGTYRSDDLHRRHPLRPLLGELLRLPRVHRLELAPFAGTDLRTYLEHLAGGSVDVGLLADIEARSEGNAFFAGELLAAGARGGLPATLADVLLADLETHPPHVQQLARAAAAAGRRVPEELLRGAVDLPPRELEEALREAVTHRLLVPDGADGYTFRHALLQEVVHADLLPGERVSLHARYARLLEERGDPRTLADLAQHHLAAHDLAGALRASVAAGAESARRLAPGDALAHYEQALQLWPAVQERDRPSDDGLCDLVDLLLRAAAAARGSGQLNRAVALAGQAVAQAPDDPARLASARSWLASYLLGAQPPQAALDEARAATALVTDPVSATAVRLAEVQVRALTSMDRDDEAMVLAGPAIEAARALGLRAAEIELLTSVAVIEGSRRHPEAAVEHLLQVSRRAADADPSTAVRIGYNLGITLIEIGDLAGAADALGATVRDASRHGVEGSLYGVEAQWMLVTALSLAGRWDEALARAGGPQPRPDWAHWVLRTAALPLLAARDPVAAIDELDRREELPDVWTHNQHLAAGARADALLWLGESDAVVDVVQRELALLDADIPHDLAGMWLSTLALAALADAAEAARIREDDAGAAAAVTAGRRFAADVEERAGLGRPRLAMLGPEGLAWLARARAEAARLEGSADVPRWQAAVEAFGFGQVYEQARCRHRLAEALAITGDRARAAEQAALAREAADGLGARPLRDAVDALARRHRLAIGGVAPAASPLTPREQEVMRLVATGLTNREIGRALFISEKTASVHVSNVLAKLEASGRAEAVAIAVRRGLLDAEPTSG